MKAMVLALGLVAVLAGVAGLSLALFSNGAQAQGQAGPAAPANVRAVNGAEPGQAVVMWDAVADAAYYRIGWVNMETFRAVQAEGGREWLDVFAFHDVVNRGQTNQTLSDLEPGVQYAFIMASVGQRFGNAAGAWSEWTYLTTTAAATSCPTNTRAEPGAPGSATPSPTPTPRPTPTGTGDYDADKDGLIEVSNLAQLAAIRTDLDGDGVSSVPAAYAIAFPNAMPRMGCPNAGCIGYELVADLDFDTNGNGAADAGDAYWNNGAGWIPIGDDDHRFTAGFDGNNHTIANLYINRRSSASPSYVGLFGYVSSSSIKRVGLVSATVSGSFYVGGLIGKISDSAISDSYATGTVSGYWAVGGLVGDSFYDSAIGASYATGAVSANTRVGGLVGRSYSSTITASYATGAVSANTRVGGLVGDSSDSAISASYATGPVSGDDGVGGLVGWDSGTTINASYAVGRVSFSGDTDTSNIGGLVGSGGRGFIIASYWDTESTGQAGSHGGVGKTTAELQSPVGYTGIYAGWNLDMDDDGNSDDPWDFGTSRQYPALKYRGMDVAAQRR